MKKLNSYIFGQSIRNTTLVFFSFGGLILLLNFADESSRRLVNDYGTADAFWYSLKTLPSALYEFAPMLFALASIVTFAGLAKNSELTIYRILAQSSASFIVRLTAPFWIISFGFMYVGDFIAPSLKTEADAQRAQLRQRGIQELEVTWFRSGDWIIGSDYVDPSDGKLINPTLYKINKNELQTFISAKQADPVSNGWMLENANQIRVEADQVWNETLNFELIAPNLSPSLVALIASKPEALRLNEHWQKLKYSIKENREDNDLRFAFWMRIAYPIILLTALILSVFFSLTSFRQKNIGQVAFSCVAVSLMLTIGLDLIAGLLSVINIPIAIAVFLPVLFSAYAAIWATQQRL